MSDKPRIRIEYIDALRGFSILGVIIAHAALITKCPGALGKVANLGAFGVQLFFVISAFTIFLTFGRSMGREQAPVRNFFIRRIFRLVPIYWLGILLYAAIYGNESRGWMPAPEYWHYPLHVFLLNLLHPMTPSTVVPGGWSISCEMLFYLSVPLWFLCVRSLKGAIIFLGLTLVLCPSIVALLKSIAAPHMTAYPPELVEQYFFRSIISQLPCFACGIVLYFATIGRTEPWSGRKAIGLFALAGVGVVAGILLPTGLSLNHVVVSLGLLSLAMALSACPLRVIVSKPMIFLGKISYSGYLFHFVVLQKLTVYTTWSFPLILAAGLPITVVLAWLSYRFIELPCSALGRRWIERLESGAPAREAVGA